MPGIDPARRLARDTDEMLSSLAVAAAHLAPSNTRWALVALGGYGAGALQPGSDLDLLVLVSGRSQAYKGFVERVLYPLWDAGLKVGHQVRDRRGQVRATREDLKTLTSTLTARHIAGDESLSSTVLAKCAADAHRRRAEVLSLLHDRPRDGSPYLLEPDLKDGAGGRRDFDELIWSAALVSGRPVGDPSALLDASLLTPDEFEELIRASETVAAARWELQREGYGNLMELDAVDALSTDSAQVQQSLALTHHLLLLVRARLTGDRRGVDVPLTPSGVFGLLESGEDALPALERAAWAGGLDSLLPGFSELMTLRRPGIGHLYTVGAHSLRAASITGSLRRLPPGGSFAEESARAVADPRALVVATLAHDIGKVVPGAGHPERGAAHAADIAARFGIPAQAPVVEALIEHHLLLAETASRGDLDDEDTILRCAARLGSRDLVAPLHLLTIADSLATGPGAWNDWHAALIGKLVTRLDAALSPDVDGAGLAQAAETTRAAAARLLEPDSAESDFVLGSPLRYLSSRTPDEVVRHAGLVARLLRNPAPGAFELDITPGPVPGSFAATIATRDRHGLLARLAGILALSGLDILAVTAVSADPGIALDTFIVHSATHAGIEPSTWARVERTLGAALRGRYALGVRLDERRRHYRSGPPAEMRVSLDADDGYAAVLRIRTPDRLGLLHDVARAIAECGLDIRSVTATTKDGIADDTFRLVDGAGGAPADPGVLGQLKMRLRELQG